MRIYKKLIKPFLFLMNPETAHNFTLFTQTLASKLGFKPFFRWFFHYHHASLETKMFGIDFKNPIGLAAGCDKKGTAIEMWETFGFGWATAGSITFQAQPGNPKPRLWRMPKDHSMQVNFGLNCLGAEKTREILLNKKPRNIWGISIARTTDIPDDQVADDYLNTFKTLYDLPDYFEINISCPNIPDTDYFKRGQFLPTLLEKLQANNPLKKPLLLKILPGLSEDELNLIIENTIKYKIDGVIISNLLKDLSKIKSRYALNQGGISGKLLEPHTNMAIKEFYKKTNGKIPIIGLGGVFDARDAYEKIKLGASMIQIYTGMVYDGPGIVRRVKRGLKRLLKQDGYTHISQAVGAYYR